FLPSVSFGPAIRPRLSKWPQFSAYGNRRLVDWTRQRGQTHSRSGPGLPPRSMMAKPRKGSAKTGAKAGQAPPHPVGGRRAVLQWDGAAVGVFSGQAEPVMMELRFAEPEQRMVS